MVNNIVIQVNNLRKAYGKKVVVEDLSFNAVEGDIYGLIGPNGSGKSTSIKMILNLVHKTGGSIQICGYDIIKEYTPAMQNIGVASESFYMYDYLTGYQNLKLVWNICRVDKHDISYLLELVGLTEAAHVKVRKYSTGMKQRLGLARALLNKPKLVVLDEPTNGLDPRGMRDFYNLVRRLADEDKVTFLIASHSLYDMEKICNKVILLDQGKTLIQGDTAQITSENGKSLEEVYLAFTS